MSQINGRNANEAVINFFFVLQIIALYCSVKAVLCFPNPEGRL